ncbi:uncharacterized protein LOC128179830 [Crassostrea angulata]|uniref:uncharacterized protein LOC128179830 n=1 Tax=Magallana angulata TaxID=2784310 RepID=UPI0022B1C89B|nr:uncharacterized protein LOC128179830 [Crassostrea angulata]
MKNLFFLYLTVYFYLAFLRSATGHGRLWEPPARSTLFRRGYSTTPNYNDNQLFCGGYAVQWMLSGGKCGICGDPYNQKQPRDHEAGGKYASGIITRHYTEGQLIDVDVEITANHKGWFEFRICPNNDVKKAATQTCFDNYLLKFANNATRYHISSAVGLHHVKLYLPPGLTCTQCILQWRYHTGNSWGVDPSGRGCLGCGPQEEFYGCSDIAVEGKSKINLSTTKATTKPTTTTKATAKTSTTTTTTPSTTSSTTTTTASTSTTVETTTNPTTATITKPSTTTTQTTTPTTTIPTTTQKPKQTTKSTPRFSSTTGSSNGSGNRLVSNGGSAKKKCSPTDVWKKTPGMTQWCVTNCRMGYCPASHCVCV